MDTMRRRNKKHTLLSYSETTLPPGAAIDLDLPQGFAFASDYPPSEKKKYENNS